MCVCVLCSGIFPLPFGVRNERRVGPANKGIVIQLLRCAFLRHPFPASFPFSLFFLGWGCPCRYFANDWYEESHRIASVGKSSEGNTTVLFADYSRYVLKCTPTSMGLGTLAGARRGVNAPPSNVAHQCPLLPCGPSDTLIHGSLH